MKLNKPNAELFIPDGTPAQQALSRTTAMAIAAHQDDIEFMAYDGIVKCFGRSDEWFTGVVLTDGKGSSRSDAYAVYSDDQFARIRNSEQKKAAFVGEYAAQFMLNYSSAELRDAKSTEIIDELRDIIMQTRPAVIYTHNLADRHQTHLAAAVKVILAIRGLQKEYRPKKLYGCEGWRDLDWLCDEAKVVFNVSAHENIAASLNGVFDSQIHGGKRYDLAIMGRRRVNATFANAYQIDNMSLASYAMDLTGLIEDDSLDIKQYALNYVKAFEKQVSESIDGVL